MAGFVRIILLLVGIAIQLEYVHSQNPMHSKGTYVHDRFYKLVVKGRVCPLKEDGSDKRDLK